MILYKGRISAHYKVKVFSQPCNQKKKNYSFIKRNIFQRIKSSFSIMVIFKWIETSKVSLVNFSIFKLNSCSPGRFFYWNQPKRLRKRGIITFFFYFFHDKSTNSVAFCVLQWMSLPPLLPSVQLKWLTPFLLQGSEPITIKGCDISQSYNPYSSTWKCKTSFVLYVYFSSRGRIN